MPGLQASVELLSGTTVITSQWHRATDPGYSSLFVKWQQNKNG